MYWERLTCRPDRRPNAALTGRRGTRFLPAERLWLGASSQSLGRIMRIRDFLLHHRSLPLWVMAACVAFIIGAWAAQNPYWWLMGCVLGPFAMDVVAAAARQVG